MHHIQKLVSDFYFQTEQKFGLTKNDLVIVAVSGGLDSMTLLTVMHKAGFNIAAAHVNYGLRGEESDLDQKLVEEYCEKLFVACYTTKADPEEMRSGNLQQNAREFRYQFFDELVARHNAKYIAVAHHEDDQVETLLFKFIRGSYSFFPRGMKAIQGAVIRPFLHMRKSQIHDIALGYQVPWREDSSNAKSDYSRNKIRNEMIPIVDLMQPGFHEMLLKRNNLNAISEDYINSMLSMEVDAFLVAKESDIIVSDGWRRADGFDILRAAYILRYTDFTHQRAEEFLHLLDGKIGRKLESQNWEIFRERECTRLVRRRDVAEVFIEISKNTSAIDYPKRIRIETSAANENFLKSKFVGVFDFDKLEFPLILRKWKEGDNIQPLGMTGRKKVSDILISEKVELSQKRKVLVLESNGEIVWVLGMRISEKYKFTEDTSTMWIMTIE
jgi:tRNA(Ile)-lysidine synthase